jgi:hypothetical protein
MQQGVGAATTEERTGWSRGRDRKSNAPPLRLRSGQALSLKTRQERGTLGNGMREGWDSPSCRIFWDGAGTLTFPISEQM